ncbi:MAG: cysteine desulfurase family protein [Caldilineaceae bacterium]|nr:cysteine desulfurase family protein [Caldilineaceae bacterium]
MMHNSSTIYADYQATTPVDPRVVERMAPHWQNSFGNPHSSDHIIGWQAAKAVDQSKTTVAGLIGADPDEIIFTSGATEANNLALFGLARRATPAQRRILVGATEHKCVLAAARALEARENFTVEQIPVDKAGFIDLDELADRLDETTLVVSVMAVNNEVGTIQDIPRIAEIVTSRGALLHCDAAQGACALGMSGLAGHADLISLSGHKMYGPQGIGALYIRRDIQSSVEPIIYGGGQQSDLRSGTVPVPLCVGMAAAAEILQTHKGPTERKRVAAQRDAFVKRLQASPYPVSLNGPTGHQRHPGNANLQFEGYVAHDLLATLQPHLAASTGSACTSGIPEPSHVLRALGLTPAQADASIRFSFGRFTTDSDIHQAANLVISSLSSTDPPP